MDFTNALSGHVQSKVLQKKFTQYLLRRLAPHLSFFLSSLGCIKQTQELACHLPELDGSNHHYQATIHFPLTSTFDWPLWLRNIDNFSSVKILGTLGIEPGAAE